MQDADGGRVLMNGAQTSVDGNLVGAAQAPVYRYRIVRPRAFDVAVSIPYSQVDAGEALTLRLSYTDEDASRKQVAVTVPAQAPAQIVLPPVTRVLSPTERQVERIRRELAADGRATVTVCAASPGATSVTIRWGGLTSTTGELTRVIRSIELLDDTAGVTADGRGITGSFRVAD